MELIVLLPVQIIYNILVIHLRKCVNFEYLAIRILCFRMPGKLESNLKKFFMY